MPVAEECPLNGPQTGCPARRSPAVCDEQKVRADAEQLGHVSAAAARLAPVPGLRPDAPTGSPRQPRLRLRVLTRLEPTRHRVRGRQPAAVERAKRPSTRACAASPRRLRRLGRVQRFWQPARDRRKRVPPVGRAKRRSLAPVLSPASDTQTAAAFVAADRVRAVQGNGDVTKWNVAAGTWRQQACALGGRLSRSEWDSTCPDGTTDPPARDPLHQPAV
jgi:hypothetical protein